ncbi:hypothetical protein GGR88_002299 [Sphingomonas jejuensis]|uniref:Uncharacterized protein n=1 Tax=Sphingomonas jejuensis TaxID=904715 RepID=A0ABX0XNI0_9SPHN|nr:hypothetical protein [Sphingomonas jejuensis]NJC34785.1 hypothetical protein [Sphingomonas jejuensis]
MAARSSTANPPPAPPRTPDGRYIVHVGRAGPRLWRATDPRIDPATRDALRQALGRARAGVRLARGDPAARAAARAAVDAAKRALGERGPVWWTDGAPDLNRRLIRNTPYAGWWASQEG